MVPRCALETAISIDSPCIANGECLQAAWCDVHQPFYVSKSTHFVDESGKASTLLMKGKLLSSVAIQVIFGTSGSRYSIMQILAAVTLLLS